jgi:hypothetical protein
VSGSPSAATDDVAETAAVAARATIAAVPSAKRRGEDRGLKLIDIVGFSTPWKYIPQYGMRNVAD